MSWSFTIFCLAFLLPVAVQALLGWAVAMPTATKFSSRTKYNVFFGIISIISLISTMGAVFLLLLSVFHLHVSGNASAPSVDTSTSATRWPSVVAIAVLSGSCLLIVLANLLVIWGNGWSHFAHVHSQSQRKEHSSTDGFPWY